MLRADTNRRILVVDDNPSIHNDFRRSLQIELEWGPLERARSTLFDRREPSSLS